ncbi:homoserine kinase [Stappia indica]|uniref:homoserine kinase n=1 Tax=Stappia indica TaxID=538381 RepID=UPI001CD28D54|nr:homoserine kinase [Stappia indica]MCA1297783.1 homoserine kinase [Stappia indica]
MAVYTDVSDEELAAFVAQYDIGGVLACKGIAEGVENSNFLLHTQKGYFILTLYEKRVERSDLPFFLELMKHLAARGISCPTPVASREGAMLGELAGRPAAIIGFLDGMWVRRPKREHCAALGEALAHFHLAGSDFTMCRPNALSVDSWRPLAAGSLDEADTIAEGLGAELVAELDHLEAHWPKGLPSGVIHADLFPDNVFFIGDRLSGLIDFYFACNDAFAYDVAICLNAWCFEPDLSFNVTKARALLDGYTTVRPFTPAEFDSLPLLARGAALRFLLTRLHDWLRVPEGALVTPKDPREYLKKLRFHQSVSSSSDYGLDH